MDHGFSYSESPNFLVVGYYNVDYTSDIDIKKSTIRYIFLLDSGAIIWNNKKLPTIALSTTKTKYIVATHATEDVIWL